MTDETTKHWSFAQALLFTGHMIDAPTRKVPRFPARAEARARAAIHEVVLGLRRDHTVGVAAGASGGDLLFHEVCAELGIPTHLLLALPPGEFIEESVASAGPDWVRRFNDLVARLGPENVKIMGPTDGFADGPTVNIWQRANFWMVEHAIALAPDRTLIALWDGKGGDGPGGAEHFATAAPRFGIRVVPPIRTQTLFE
jgi:hypothetical protein